MAQHSEVMGALAALTERLSVIEGKMGDGGGVAATATAAPAGGTSKAVTAFDEYSRECLDPFVAACADLGSPEAAQCADVVKKGWAGMRGFLATASQSKKPAAFPQDCMVQLKPCQEAMAEASKNVSRGDWECHQKTVSEGMACLSWLVIVPSPRDFIENFVGSQDFWANKLRVKYRKTEPKHVVFCDTFKKLITELMVYVKEHHTTGVTFNPKGGDLTKAFYIEVPPPSPPAVKPAAAAQAAGGGIGDLKAAFAAKGNATAGLKTVTKDMQTWRTEFKKDDAAPVVKKAKPKVVPRQQTVTKGEPKVAFQSQGMKWLVENQQKAQGVVTVTMDPKEGHKHTVYVATSYEATVNIVGKCKGVAVDACAKCNVLFDSAISSLELVNCKSMKCQARGTIPSVAIDKTDGVCVFLSKETLAMTIFTTSKSSDMQISFPDENGEMVEAPIPEQFVHRASLVAGKPKVSSDVSDLYSH